MTDREIEFLIETTIRKAGITWRDMVGGPYVDPEQDPDKRYGNPETVRRNKFTTNAWSDRLIELLSDGEYDPNADYHQIRIPVRDLIHFWWNRCIDKEEMLDMILEDIFTYFKDTMLPKKEAVKTDTGIDVRRFRLTA